MKQLTHLELGGNDNITIDSLLYLVERIGSLRSLCVSNLKQLNQDDIRSLQKRNPHLRIIN